MEWVGQLVVPGVAWFDRSTLFVSMSMGSRSCADDAQRCRQFAPLPTGRLYSQCTYRIAFMQQQRDRQAQTEGGLVGSAVSKHKRWPGLSRGPVTKHDLGCHRTAFPDNFVRSRGKRGHDVGNALQRPLPAAHGLLAVMAPRSWLRNRARPRMAVPTKFNELQRISFSKSDSNKFASFEFEPAISTVTTYTLQLRSYTLALHQFASEKIQGGKTGPSGYGNTRRHVNVCNPQVGQVGVQKVHTSERYTGDFNKASRQARYALAVIS